MKYKVFKATNWAEVENAAAISQRCIRPESESAPHGSNWAKAEETWETMQDTVLYFIIQEDSYAYEVKGYVRLFNTTPGMGNPTWVLDFMWPISSDVVALVAEKVTGNIMVKNCFGGDPLSSHWPKVTLSLAVPEAPYRVQTDRICDWLLVN